MFFKKKHNKAGYFIHKVTDTNVKLCKVLNEYDSIEEANKNLVSLLSKEKSEEDILNDFDKKKL